MSSQSLLFGRLSRRSAMERCDWRPMSTLPIAEATKPDNREKADLL